MGKTEILNKMNEIFRDAFDKEDLTISFNTTAADVEGWDSLMQMSLIEMMEDEFNIRFNMDEIIAMENIGVMTDIILEHLG